MYSEYVFYVLWLGSTPFKLDLRLAKHIGVSKISNLQQIPTFGSLELFESC